MVWYSQSVEIDTASMFRTTIRWSHRHVPPAADALAHHLFLMCTIRVPTCVGPTRGQEIRSAANRLPKFCWSNVAQHMLSRDTNLPDGNIFSLRFEPERYCNRNGNRLCHRGRTPLVGGVHCSDRDMRQKWTRLRRYAVCYSNYAHRSLADNEKSVFFLFDKRVKHAIGELNIPAAAAAAAVLVKCI